MSRGLSRRPYSGCSHVRLVYDDRERRIWCKDCERDVEAFDAFEILIRVYAEAIRKLEEREERLKQVEGFQARSLAARELDKAWQKRTTVPACPNCGEGLLPEDFKYGVRQGVNREWAEKRQKRRSE